MTFGKQLSGGAAGTYGPWGSTGPNDPSGGDRAGETYLVFGGGSDGANTAPILSGLPDPVTDEDVPVDNAIDLWAYASDAEEADSDLTFTITNVSDPNVGVSLDSNRYIDISPMADWYGTSDVTVQVSDGLLTATDTFTITVVDTTPPAPPAIAGIATDTGSSSSDAITSDTTLVISGTAEANSTVEVFEGGSSLGTTPADGSGNWTYDYTGTSLADGVYSFTATATDAAANTSEVSAPLSVTVDTVAPQIVSWYSAKDQGVVGEVLLEIPADGSFVESRNDGISRLLLAFDEAVDPSTFDSVELAGNDETSSALDLSGIDITTSTRDGDTVGVIDFSESLPDYARYAARVSGIEDLAGNLVTSGTERLMTSLIGDASGDSVVKNLDVLYAQTYRNSLAGAPIDPGDVNQVHTDLNGDGFINNTDVLWAQTIRDMGRDARGIAFPELSGGGEALVGSPGNSALAGQRGLGHVRKSR